MIEIVILRRQLGRLELGRLAWTTVAISVASVLLAASAYSVWAALHDLLGDALAAQIVSLALGLGVGAAVYAAAVSFLRIPEWEQIVNLFRRRRAG